jgi:hypothetical protein
MPMRGFDQSPSLAELNYRAFSLNHTLQMLVSRAPIPN